MKFPTLYKRTTTGSIQTWEIEVVGSQYRTHSGKLDGKIVTSEWTQCEGKNTGKANATSDEEQALKQAQAIIQKRLEKHYFESIEDIDIKQFVKAMLAASYKDLGPVSNLPYKNIAVQPKLDGIRCIVTKDGMQTRGGKEIISAPHIFRALQPLFAKYPNLVLDGEMYTDRLRDDFNKICSLGKKTKPTQKDLDLSEQFLQYWIYDIADTKATFTERHNRIKALFDNELAGIGCLVMVPTVFTSDQDEIDRLYEEYLEKGQEGQMIRNCDAKYQGKRTKDLLKRKQFVDEEFRILGISEGSGNWSGKAKRVHYVTADGKEFDTGLKGTMEFCTKLLENKDQVIGKQATVRYLNLTPDGKPRGGVTQTIHFTPRW